MKECVGCRHMFCEDDLQSYFGGAPDNYRNCPHCRYEAPPGESFARGLHGMQLQLLACVGRVAGLDPVEE